MKKNYLFNLLFLTIPLLGIAQKDQIKNAQIELNQNKNVDAALKILNDIEYLITNAKIEDKSEYYFTKAKVLTELANKKIDVAQNMSQAVACYNELILNEVDAGNLKYAALARQGITDLKDNLQSIAIKNNNASKFSEAANEFYYLYEMDTKDTIQLYNAAANYLNSKEFEKAIKSFEKLKKLKYTGKGINYYAVNKSTQVEEFFSNVQHRDLAIKQGTHEKSRNQVAASKKTDILKYLAYLYGEKGDAVNAELNYKAIIDNSPKNIEAYLDIAYIKMDIRKELIRKMSLLGTSTQDMKLYDELNNQKSEVVNSAITYLEKALTLEPNNKDVSKLLLNLYRSQDMMDKYEALKAKN